MSGDEKDAEIARLMRQLQSVQALVNGARDEAARLKAVVRRQDREIERLKAQLADRSGWAQEAQA